MIVSTYTPNPITVYASSVCPEIRTETGDPEADNAERDAIVWADAHPAAYTIVRSHRSIRFGQDSSLYFGYQRGSAPKAALERLVRFREETDRPSIFGFAARHTLAHWNAPEFTGARFFQWDGQSHRACIDLDYTPSTLSVCVREFLTWAGTTFPTARVDVVGRRETLMLRPPFLQE